MAEYIINEALFEPPAGWVDGSVNALGPSDDRDDLKIMVLRGAAGSESLESFARQQTRTLLQRMSWFVVLSEALTTVAGQPAHALRATFKDSGRDLYQHRVMFAHRDQFVSIIVAGLVNATAECDAILERIVSSVELRRR